MRVIKYIVVALGATLGMKAYGSGALYGQFFAMSGIDSGYAIHPDCEKGVDWGVVPGLVQSTLGPDGLPVVSAYGATYSGPSGPITDVNSKGEILWWTPHTVYNGAVVLFDHTETDTIPFDNNEYPFGAGNDSSYYQTAHWSGDFETPAGGSVTFTVGSDDDAWVFLNGNLVVDGGGVKPFAPAPTTITGLLPGMNDVEVFFADRHTTGSEMSFDANVVLAAVPEPAPTAVLGLGVLGLLVRRRRLS